MTQNQSTFIRPAINFGFFLIVFIIEKQYEIEVIYNVYKSRARLHRSLRIMQDTTGCQAAKIVEFSFTCWQIYRPTIRLIPPKKNDKSKTYQTLYYAAPENWICSFRAGQWSCIALQGLQITWTSSPVEQGLSGHYRRYRTSRKSTKELRHRITTQNKIAARFLLHSTNVLEYMSVFWQLPFATASVVTHELNVGLQTIWLWNIKHE